MKLDKKFEHLKDLTFGDILHFIDFPGFFVIYINDDEEIAWDGFETSIPYWIAEMKLNFDGDNMPLEYRHSLGEDYKNRAGFVVYLKEETQ